MSGSATPPTPPTGGEHPFRSALDAVKDGKWNEMFSGSDPLVTYKKTFERKRFGNSLIALGFFSFVAGTFFFTMRKIGQEDFINQVDERGYKKSTM